ncbi:hypothetical protein RJ640_009622 [Escallonia rubra]|uniref:Uncharacterized protein n=1 Tax=Escallonia rubra TaxID=112253 RepID=A0AA88R6Q6_9ASTE|nr:hypothetical protein RJ640_009622 [Escallonia rubra]
MGTCLSKKNTNSSTPLPLPDPPLQITTTKPEKKNPEEETLKKEIFVIKHRKSHEIDRRCSDEEKPGSEKKTSEITELGSNVVIGGNGVVPERAAVRTSSCTKEEVDAILIQCGRLSRSSSTGKAAGSDGRKYSGSKRSYDFDHEDKKGSGFEENNYEKNVGGGGGADGDEDEAAVERIHRHRQRHRQSRAAGSSPHGRRRTPSREREQQQQQQQQQRSGSRERGSGGGGGGRRVSRSPARRSESPITNGANSSASGCSNTSNSNRPGKMISVPATVNNGGGGGAGVEGGGGVKRIQVKRNVGEGTVAVRTAASPRSRSPARGNVRVSNENQNQQLQQPVSLSRSNSRKAEHSPYRRNPLCEIDNNVIGVEQPAGPGSKAISNNILHQAQIQKPTAENTGGKVVALGIDNKSNSNKGTLDNNDVNVNGRAKEQQLHLVEEAIGLQAVTSNVAVTVVPVGAETLKPQSLTRSRSSRRSRDLDLNPETSSYTALLLEDIQNFHQKSTPPSFSLPACLTKANSILEAVADLNSSSSSNLSCAFSDDRRRNPSIDQFNKNDDNSGANPAGKKRLDTKDPIVESEVIANNDLMEPSFHKYVTVKRGASGGEDMEEQESSGSNSFVGGPQHWLSSSWEPNSADSTDRWTSRSNTREDDSSSLEFHRHAISESGRDGAQRRLTEKKRESDHQQNGIGRGRVGSSRGVYSMSATAAATT